jgi:hypothetical protein
MLAETLEATSPGLALLVQLRSRLFADAARAAAARSFGQVVVVGRGFAIAEGDESRSGVPVVEVEHPAVLATGECRCPGRGSIGIAAEDLGESAWTALCSSAWDPRRRRTFFIVEGLSMWGGAGALAFWLRMLGREAAAGSEMLLNLLDTEAAEQAREAGRAISVAPAGIDVLALPALARAHAVDLVHSFDSERLQHAQLGFSDLLVREHYAWLRSGLPSSCRDVACPPLPTRRMHSRAVRDLPARWRLRDGLALWCDAAGRAVLCLEVTPRRVCTVPLEAGDLAWRLQAAGLLAYDRDGSPFDLRVDAIARRLRLSPYETCEPAKCRLDVVRALALAALATDDALVRADVHTLLAGTTDNVAGECLRRLLADRDVVCARDGNVSVAVRRPARTREALAAVRDAFDGVAALLEVAADPHVLVDLTSGRDGIPLTIVADAAPCTVVRIPPCRWAPAVLYHEITHVLATCGSQWVSEGLAVWVQRQLAPEETFPPAAPASPTRRRRSLSSDLSDGRVRDANAGACRLPASAYGDAGDYVAWLVARLGRSSFLRLFDACRSGMRAPVDALCRSLGFRLAELEADWLGGSP